MNRKKDTYVRNVAAEYFRDAESRLIDLQAVFVDLCSAMASTTQEYRKAVKRTSLVPYLKRRPGKAVAAEVYWGGTCRRRPTFGPRSGGAPGKKRWVKHLAGGLTRKRIVQLAKDVGNIRLFRNFDEQYRHLNEARGIIVRARLAFEHTLLGLATARGWEAEAPAFAAPLVSPGLPDTSKRALARAWSLCLRLASAEVELRAIADRHNARPAYRGLRLLFERNAKLPYGRSCWTLFGERILGQASGLAKGGRPVEDEANLTELVMRKLRIPAKARSAIRPHEAARRRVEWCRRAYIEIFWHLKKLTGEAIARVAKIGEQIDLLRRAS